MDTLVSCTSLSSNTRIVRALPDCFQIASLGNFLSHARWMRNARGPSEPPERCLSWPERHLNAGIRRGVVALVAHPHITARRALTHFEVLNDAFARLAFIEFQHRATALAIGRRRPSAASAPADELAACDASPELP